MSYDIFKQNMLAFMLNQPSITAKEQFARKLVEEYDALIKRGFDSVNGITLQQGNVELMEQVLNGVLEIAFQQSSGEHAIITNMGKAFQAYWTPQVGFARQLEDIQGVKKTLLERVLELTETTSSEIINDEPGDKENADGSFDGYKLTKRLQEIKDQIKNTEPPTPVRAGSGKNEVLPYENQPSIPVTCPTLDEIYLKNGQINYELQLSPNIKLKHLTSRSGGNTLKDITNTVNRRYNVKERGALRGKIKIPEIVCNLKSLAVNIVEPLLVAYPGFMVPAEGKDFKPINSAFRNYQTSSGGSQHPLGEAIDIQWFAGGSWKGPNYSTEKYMEIANWCLQNLPVDQLIYEHTGTYGRVWLHISHYRQGPQRKDNAWTMYGGNYRTGFYNSYPSK
jgi:hypothetical protein